MEKYQHTHSHGNHEHTHSHHAGDHEHIHGWHHAPDKDEGDHMFGQEPDRPKVPSVYLPMEQYGPGAPDGPVVIVPYVPSHWRPEVADRLDEIGAYWCKVDVSGTEWDYWQLLCNMWATRTDFVIVEQDIVPGLDFLDQFRDCPRPWCGYSYWLHERQISVADYQPDGRSSTAMGCVRFRASLMEANPAGVVDFLDCSWPRVDYAMTVMLRAMGEDCHRHHPDAHHLERLPADWRRTVG